MDPFLVNEPTTYAVFNCEQTSALADHRLKCLLTLETRNVRLTDTNLARSFYTDGRFEYRLGAEVHTLTGAPSTWPGASHAVAQTASGRAVEDRWEVGSGAERRTYAAGYYAITGVIGHKAAFQWHLFEPAADPSLPSAQRQALESANIKLIHIYRDVRSGTTTVRILGTDDVFRNL